VPQWAQTYGGTGYDSGSEVTIDGNGGFYLAGGFELNAAFSAIALTSQGQDDGFVLRGDAQGNTLWARQLAGVGSDGFLDIKLASNGGLYLLGTFSSSVVNYDSQLFTNAGGYDVLLMRCDRNGNFVWGQRGGGTGNDLGASLSCGANGLVSFSYSFATSTQYGPFAFTNAGATNAVLLQFQDNTITASRAKVEQVALSAYPNPASSTSSLTLTSPSFTKNAGTVELINAVGRVVRRMETSLNIDGRITLVLSDCIAGTYTVRCMTANSVATTKLVLL
jgi:hypothetical protein